MKSYLLAICCLFSATLFSQNPGVTVQIDLFNAPQEPVLAVVDFVGSTETESYTLFLNEGFFSTFYFDPQISWNQGIVHIEDCNGDSLFDSFANSDSTDFYYTSFFYCQSDSVLGCTDPSALNFNSFATIDDGSCIYTEPDNDLCSGAQPLEPGTILIDNSFATQNEGIFGECWNFGSGEGEQSSLWFSFTTPANPAQISIEAIADGTWTLTDTQFGLFTECGGEMIYCDGNSGEGLLSAFEFSCGQLDTNTTYILMVDGWNGDLGTCLLNYEVTAPCDQEIFGCTDPAAGNYNPNATIDDGSCEYFECESNEVVVLINTENWGYEISWNIRNESGDEVAGSGEYPNYSTITELACLENGCYTFELFDSFGDGWNDGTFELILDGTTLALGTLEDGEFGSIPFGVNAEGCIEEDIFGCTDPSAINFSPEATIDDGTCQYGCSDVLIGFDFFNGAPADSSYLNTMWTITNQYDSIAFSGFWDSWAPQIDLCLENGCYTFTLSNVSPEWNGLYNVITSNQVVSSGFFTGENETLQFQFGVNQEGCEEGNDVFGCTDPAASNYNPAATIDDGSCEYTECDNNEVVVLINTENWGYEISWNIRNEAGDEVAGSGDYPNYSTITELACLENGCYTFELFDSFGDGWNDGTFELILDGITLASGTLEDGEFGSVPFGINTEGCGEVEEIFGCTDPFAINFNPDATINDGSCEYSCNEVYLGFDFVNGAPDDSSFYFMHWVIQNEFNEVVEAGEFYNWAPQYDLCLNDGCYTFTIFNVSPEWNGIYNLFMGNEILAQGEFSGESDIFEFTFGVNEDGCGETNEIFGCTDPEANNYDPDATIDDDSCIYECESNTILLHVNTSAEVDSANYLQYGIGLEYNAYVVTGSTSAGQNFGIDICLEDGCYNLYLESWQNQSWVGSEIYATTEFGDTLFYAAPQVYQELYVYSFGVNEEGCGDPQEVLGCTDPEALNYNPEATNDDGSCEYDFECGISFDVVSDSTGGNMFYIIPSENILDASSVLWDFGDGSTSAEFYPTHIYEGDGPFTLCLFVSFEDDNGNYCEISYCEVLDGSTFGSGFLSGGFMINVIPPGTLSENVPLAEKELSVYPNPTNDITTIRFMSDQSDKLTLRVMDLNGKVIEQKIISSSVGQQKIQVDLSEFPQGLYLIGLEQNGSGSYAKVVRR